ncbi:hypothetical protein [Paracoccus sp. (in: a-proteobacteria)]|uniref:hypothetical protein n=1 Tax=Paracoccus sp. TaxID=267 RepID=UPI00396CECFF
MAIAILGLASVPAFASTEEAWAELRKALVDDCRVAAEAFFSSDLITVLPNEHGSEGFAVALIVARKAEAAPELSVCLRDKQSGKTELSAPFAEMPDLSTVEGAAP